MHTPVRGFKDISLLFLRVHVIHNKIKKLSVIKLRTCSSKNSQHLLFKQLNREASLPWKGEVLFILNPSNYLLNNAADDMVAGCINCH